MLTQSQERGIPIYCFWARSGEEDWEYLGLGEVESWSLEQQGGRKVVEFRLALLRIPSVGEFSRISVNAEKEVEKSGAPTLKVDGGKARHERLQKGAVTGVLS